MSNNTFYVKGEVDGVEVKVPFTGTAYTVCHDCGEEMDVDIISAAQEVYRELGSSEVEPNLLVGGWCCGKCIQAMSLPPSAT